MNSKLMHNKKRKKHEDEEALDGAWYTDHLKGTYLKMLGLGIFLFLLGALLFFFKLYLLH